MDNIFLKEFIKLNANMDMITKSVKCLALKQKGLNVWN